METISHVVSPAGAPGHTRAAETSQLSDELRAAAAELANGCLEALDRIWELCADAIYGLALWRTGRPVDAEDVVQEVFVRLARRPEHLQRAYNPRAYLLRMAHNAATDHGRRGAADQLDPEAAAALVEPSSDGWPDSRIESRIDAAAAGRLLAALPSPQREVVFLRHFAELSFREIGQVTGISTFTAASRYRLAIRRLRRLLGVHP